MEPLVTDDFEEDAQEDEDEEDEEEEAGSGACCKHCGCELAMAEEVFLARVMKTTAAPPYLVELDPTETDYVHIPAFFCFDCWEERLEEVETALEDVPPTLDARGMATCDVCGSDILAEEAMAVVSFGEIHWSSRAPNGEYIPQFVSMQNDKHLCLGCVYHLNQVNDDPIWEDDIEPIAGTVVCVDGLFSRCWRYGNCTCPGSQGKK
jgi:hypothetical protein